jgi:hypothetical protein
VTDRLQHLDRNQISRFKSRFAPVFAEHRRPTRHALDPGTWHFCA